MLALRWFVIEPYPEAHPYVTEHTDDDESPLPSHAASQQWNGSRTCHKCFHGFSSLIDSHINKMRTVSSLVCPDAALSCSAFLYSLNARRGFWLTFTYYHRLIYYITRVFCCQADLSLKYRFFLLYPQVL